MTSYSSQKTFVFLIASVSLGVHLAASDCGKFFVILYRINSLITSLFLYSGITHSPPAINATVNSTITLTCVAEGSDCNNHGLHLVYRSRDREYALTDASEENSSTCAQSQCRAVVDVLLETDYDGAVLLCSLVDNGSGEIVQSTPQRILLTSKLP